MQGFPPIPRPKTFRLTHGGDLPAPSGNAGPAPSSRPSRVAPWPGAPLEPTGNPMLDGVGPASYALRDDVPDLTYDGEPRIVPLRVAPATSSSTATRPDPRGMAVVGADGAVAGIVRDIWVDRAEPLIRYLEVELRRCRRTATSLLPMRLAPHRRRRRQVKVHVDPGRTSSPTCRRLANPDQVTLLEEDQITAYFAGGTLYATPARAGPLL